MPFSNFQKLLLTGLRMAIGWHFLYEGIAKIFTPGWSSNSYLLNSGGPLANVFISMAENQFLVYLLDFTVIFGLILIGLGLFFGIATRAISLAAVRCTALEFVFQY